MRYILLIVVLLSATFANAQVPGTASEGVASMRLEVIGDTEVYYDSFGVNPTYLRLVPIASFPLAEMDTTTNYWSVLSHPSRLFLTCYDHFTVVGLTSVETVRFGEFEKDRVRVVVETYGHEDTYEKGEWIVSYQKGVAVMMPTTEEAQLSILKNVFSADYVALTYYEFSEKRYYRSVYSANGLIAASKKFSCKAY